MLSLNVAQLLKDGVGAVRYHSVDDVTSEGMPVRGDVKLLRTNRSVLVTGRLRTSSVMTCSRCLEAYEHPLKFEMEEEFAFPSNFGGPAPSMGSRESGLFAIDEENILDLTEAVRQYVLLNSPMKPICHPSCPGLCASCGRNLNRSSCDCETTGRESRWAKLEQLRCRD